MRWRLPAACLVAGKTWVHWGPKADKLGIKPGTTTQKTTRRTNEIDFLQLPWAQEAPGSNPGAPTKSLNASDCEGEFRRSAAFWCTTETIREFRAERDSVDPRDMPSEPWVGYRVELAGAALDKRRDAKRERQRSG